MGEGSEVARRTDRTLRRHARNGVPLQHVEQAIDHDPPDARMTAREADYLHRHYEPHHRPGKVVPESAAMRQAEVGLKFRPPLVRDAGLGEEEIGRASCRERVCPYVWISVV